VNGNKLTDKHYRHPSYSLRRPLTHMRSPCESMGAIMAKMRNGNCKVQRLTLWQREAPSAPDYG